MCRSSGTLLGWREFPFLVVGLSLGIFASIQHYLAMRMGGSFPSWQHALYQEMPPWVLWMLAFPVVVWFVNRYPFVRGVIPRRILQHLAFATLLITIHTAILVGVFRWAGMVRTDVPYVAMLVRRTPWEMTRIVSYVAVLGLAVAREYYLRYQERTVAASELAARLAEAQLAALRMQLNPHFLFNTMNSIAMLVRKGQSAEAVSMLAGLSDLLRTVLEEAPPQEVTLRDELAFIGRYLDMERIRFADRLEVRIDVPPDLLDAFVPHLVLQPLVENALKHGLAQHSTAGTVEVRAEREGDRLSLTVRDDGPGVSPDAARDGVGLKNTRSRLARLYGAAQSFTLDRAVERGTVATVVLPFHLGPVPTAHAAG